MGSGTWAGEAPFAASFEKQLVLEFCGCAPGKMQLMREISITGKQWKFLAGNCEIPFNLTAVQQNSSSASLSRPCFGQVVRKDSALTFSWLLIIHLCG